MIVVGLTGKAGAGKSQVADHLVAEHGFMKLSFAGPLKKMLRTLDPIVGLDPWTKQFLRVSDLYKRYGDDAGIKKSPYADEMRRLWQVLGTDCIRAVDEGFWVRAALAQLTDPDGRYVFDDVRFPNEAEAITGQRWVNDRPGGYLWRVVRPDHDGGAGNHVSEQHADTMDVDREVLNTQSIGTLHTLIDMFIDDVFDGVL